MTEDLSRKSIPRARIFDRIIRRLLWLGSLAYNAIAADAIAATVAVKTLVLFERNARIISQHQNPLNKCGKKVFSQGDEDGITYEIINRIGIKDGVFAEFGVGDGLENNTIFLALLGWKGFWVDGAALAFTPLHREKKDFAFLKEFINRDNILSVAHRGLEVISETVLDVISLDFDGNDFYFVEELLSGGLLPKLFIVEYNAKFIPPIRWKIKYDKDHRWTTVGGDDYYGASLMEFNVLFEKFGYFLACCNSSTGANAFFVHSSYREQFRDVPDDIDVLWAAPQYIHGKYGHPVSPKTVAFIMSNIASVRAGSTDAK